MIHRYNRYSFPHRKRQCIVPACVPGQRQNGRLHRLVPAVWVILVVAGLGIPLLGFGDSSGVCFAQEGQSQDVVPFSPPGSPAANLWVAREPVRDAGPAESTPKEQVAEKEKKEKSKKKPNGEQTEESDKEKKDDEKRRKSSSRNASTPTVNSPRSHSGTTRSPRRTLVRTVSSRTGNWPPRSPRRCFSARSSCRVETGSCPRRKPTSTPSWPAGAA